MGFGSFFKSIGKGISSAAKTVSQGFKAVAPALPALLGQGTALPPSLFGFKSARAQRTFGVGRQLTSGVIKAGLPGLGSSLLGQAESFLATKLKGVPSFAISRSALAKQVATSLGTTVSAVRRIPGSFPASLTPRITSPIARGGPPRPPLRAVKPSFPSFGGVAMAAAGPMRAVAGVAAARGAVVSMRVLIGAKIRSAIGKSVSPRGAIQLIKRVGLEAAAVALGITAVELAQYTLEAPTRRRRGISAADIRRTKSTLRKIGSIACQVKEVVGTGATFGRRRKCG